MKPSRVATVLDTLLDGRWATFLWGPPGVGKSSVVRQLAQRRKMPLIDIRAALLDPTDLRGIPAVSDERSVWYPPAFLPRLDQPPGILFLDELSAAPTLVQASLYQLTLDRRVGEYVLPDGWHIVAAGNRAEDASIVFRMPTALANRFIHIDFEVDFQDWKYWALDNDVHPIVVGFLALRQELLFNMKSTDRAFPSPRSWEIASDVIKTLGNVRSAEDVLLGVVGQAATIELMQFVEHALTEEMVKSILASPSAHALPAGLGELYALVSYVAASAKLKHVSDAAGHLLDRLPPELAVLLARDILRVNSKFIQNKEYRAFVKKNAEFIA